MTAMAHARVAPTHAHVLTCTMRLRCLHGLAPNRHAGVRVGHDVSGAELGMSPHCTDQAAMPLLGRSILVAVRRWSMDTHVRAREHSKPLIMDNWLLILFG